MGAGPTDGDTEPADPAGPAGAEPTRHTPLDGDPAVGPDTGRPHPQHPHERLEELEAAAIAAEMATGRQEETVEEAKRSLVKRTIRITAGLVVTGFGVLLLVLPGPGLLVVAAGLVILAQDVPFAARLLEKVRERLPADADGKVPKSTIAMGLGISVLAVGGSLWWTLLR